MPGENVYIDNNNSVKKNTEIAKRIINVDEIEGRTCYFSLSGDLAFKELEKNFSTFSNTVMKRKIKEAFTQRLYFAILMFDHVVMHCSDPLRTEIVLEILEENVEWIKNERILFIFSNGINNIEQDYVNYINRKINEYKEGYYSEKEAQSLSQPHIDENYYKRVKALLSKTPCLVRKPQEEDFSFHKLVLNDLNFAQKQEQVVIDSKSDMSQILSLNLSLSQLLNIMHCNVGNDKNKCEYVFPNTIVCQVCKNIKKHLKQKNTIARIAIVDLLKNELSKQGLTEIQEDVLDAISLRMDVLYCHMNSGNQMILEFHPSYEYRSMYRLDCFLEFLKIICKTYNKIELNFDNVNKLLLDDDLQTFRSCYLSSMADMYEHKNLNKLCFERGTEDFPKLFTEISIKNIEVLSSNSFESIKNMLNGEIV